MSWPVRMNPVDIEIRQLNVAETIVDQDYGSAITEKDRNTVLSLRGQVNFGQYTWDKQVRSRYELPMTGDVGYSLGHLCFKEEYLVKLGVTIKKDDMVTKIAGREVEFLVSEVRPVAPLRGTHRLIIVKLKDNEEKG